MVDDDKECIICQELLDVVPGVLDRLDVLDASVAGTSSSPSEATTTTTPPTEHHHNDHENTDHEPIAILPCKWAHALHDKCLREWAQQANTCPTCRTAFNLVKVISPQGVVLSEYEVETKTQPVTDYGLGGTEEIEEPSDPCPICGESDQEDVLLLCDRCDVPYHTHCVNLDRVPNGNWFCMECAHNGAYAHAAESLQTTRRDQAYSGRSRPRTQASVRRNRRRARTEQWAGVWGQIGNRIHDSLGLDLDFSDDDQQHMGAFRRHQRRTTEERMEFERWQQRLTIASRPGARQIFRNSAPVPVPRPERRRTPELSPEENLAWGDLERAKEMDVPATTPRPRKRKSRSATASPGEPSSQPMAPERKLKRPRTRRVLDNANLSSAGPSTMASRPPTAVRAGSPPRPAIDTNSEPPSFLSSLLKEVETATSDDDTPTQSLFSASTYGQNRATSPSIAYSSPGASPSPTTSTYHTPRAMSATPPPMDNMKRPGSPVPLTSRVEPNYSPNSSPADNRHQIRDEEPLGYYHNAHVLEHRSLTAGQQEMSPPPQTSSMSPARVNMTIETKEGINRIVKSMLSPYYKANQITKEQYAEINRDISRKLYDWAADCDYENNKDACEKLAMAEVANAVKSLTATVTHAQSLAV